MKKEITEKILNETELGYDSIADKFSQTRKHFWRGLEFIGDFCVEKDNVLDYGCGNGRLLELFIGKNINYFGVDVSQKLIEHAQSKYLGKNINFFKINPSQTSLAFETGFFNAIYSIAVFHHFPSKQYREEVAKELFYKTKESGRIVVTVWYLWPVSLRQIFFSVSRGEQKKYFKNILTNWKNKILGKSQLDWNDCYVSFTDNEGRKIQRFHRAFTKRELKKLFQNAGFVIEKCEIVDGRNILLVGKKDSR